MRISVRSRFRCRISSCPAACGIRCVKPSTATTSPSDTRSRTASLRDAITRLGSEGEWVSLAAHGHPAQLRELVDDRLSAEAAEPAVLHTSEGHRRLASYRLYGDSQHYRD